MTAKKTHKVFVKQCNKIHNNKYQYYEKYISDAIKINIYCNIHGNFKQTPSSHLQGVGCPKCAIEYRSMHVTKSNEYFLTQANIIHKNKYIYLEEYKTAKTKIKIKCPIHGIFMQAPHHHVRGNGCPICAGRTRKTTEMFIQEAILVHGDKYSYPAKYTNARTNIEIVCSFHGIFKQVPDVHLNGHGCPGCATKTASKAETAWLDYLGIPDDNLHRSVRIKIGNTYIKPDGFDKSTNTIYEFYGDYYHGNPNIFESDKINHKNKKTMKELFQHTLVREELIKTKGYKIVTIWESDWNKIKERLK